MAEARRRDESAPEIPAPELLELLVCPLTHQRLRLAPRELLAHIAPPLEAALVREDGRVAYPIRGGIPVLLPDEAISLDPAPG